MGAGGTTSVGPPSTGASANAPDVEKKGSTVPPAPIADDGGEQSTFVEETPLSGDEVALLVGLGLGTGGFEEWSQRTLAAGPDLPQSVAKEAAHLSDGLPFQIGPPVSIGPHPYSSTGVYDVGLGTIVGPQSMHSVAHDVVVGGKTVRVILPSDPSLAQGVIPTVDEVAQMLSVVPQGNLQTIDTVQVQPFFNPRDPYIRAAWGLPADQNTMLSYDKGAATVDLYPQEAGEGGCFEAPDFEACMGTAMVHESGHGVSQHFTAEDWVAWELAMVFDGNLLSDQGALAPKEDWSEFCAAMEQVEGTPDEAAFRAQHPNRSAFYDERMRRPAVALHPAVHLTP